MKKISILVASLVFGMSFAQLSSYEVASQTKVSALDLTNRVDENCQYGVEYSDPTEEGVYIGDFTPIYVANDLHVEANSTFALQQLDIFPTIGVNGFISGATIRVYDNMVDDDGKSHPGEMLQEEYIETIDQILLQQISFTGGEEAEEYIATFDLSSFGSLEGGNEGATYWVAYQVDASPTPLRYFGIVSENTPSTNFSTDGGETYGSLATQTDSRARDLPYTIHGDCSTMGVKEMSNAVLSVYPNPAKDVINISLKNTEIKSISVTNLSGQVVATSKTANVNVAALPAGVYVVKVLDVKGATHTSKVVVK